MVAKKRMVNKKMTVFFAFLIVVTIIYGFNPTPKSGDGPLSFCMLEEITYAIICRDIRPRHSGIAH